MGLISFQVHMPVKLPHEAERRWVLVLIQLEQTRIALLTQAAR
jgi:hypothetical protein